MIWPYLDILIALVAAFLTYRFFRWEGQTPIESIMLAGMIGFTAYTSAYLILSAREHAMKTEAQAIAAPEQSEPTKSGGGLEK